MPLTDLVHAIEQDAATHVRALLDAARTAAEHIEAEGRRDRAERVARATGEADRTHRAEADLRLAAAQREARARVLTARTAMLERVHAAVRARLPEVAPQAVDALARAALACSGDQPGVRRDVETGVVIELPTGVKLVATLDALLEREWPRLAADVLARVEAT